jgi:hypothetical protein
VTKSALVTRAWFITPPDARFNTQRFMWDRQVYRKDYLVPFSKTVLPAGFQAELAEETRFFKTTEANFIKDAEKIFPVNQ